MKYHGNIKIVQAYLTWYVDVLLTFFDIKCQLLPISIF
jgi:hypothetical protein